MDKGKKGREGEGVVPKKIDGKKKKAESNFVDEKLRETALELVCFCLYVSWIVKDTGARVCLASVGR